MSDRERINADVFFAGKNCDKLRAIRLKYAKQIVEGSMLELELDQLQERLDRAARELGREVGGGRVVQSPLAPASNTSSEESTQGSSPDDEPPHAA